MSNLRQPAALLLGALFLYYEIFRWLPLGRWNWQFHLPVSNDQFYPDLVIGALLLWFAWSFARQSRPGMVTASVLLSLWVVVHFFDWWLPYLRDLPQNAARFSFYHSHTQLLPVFGHHYPPDGAHTILDLILYPTCLVALLATVNSSKRSAKAYTR